MVLGLASCSSPASLTCLPDGSRGGHPEDKFPISCGVHAVACDQCHKVALGTPDSRDNTDCLTCHTEAESDPQHSGLSIFHYDPSQPHFCLDCHPRGRP